jgi:hypothetical protein
MDPLWTPYRQESDDEAEEEDAEVEGGLAERIAAFLASIEVVDMLGSTPQALSAFSSTES